MFERMLCIASLAIVAPILNVAVYILIGIQYSWYYSAILAFLWAVSYVGMTFMGIKQGKI